MNELMALRITGYQTVQYLLVCFLYGNISPEQIEVSEEELTGWIGKCRQVEADVAQHHLTPYYKRSSRRGSSAEWGHEF